MQGSSAFFGIGFELLTTIVVVIAVVGINLAISAGLRSRTRLSRETKLRASVFWRNASLLLAALALLFVWRAELRAVAFSLAALSVSLAIGGKELLTPMLGYVYRGRKWCGRSTGRSSRAAALPYCAGRWRRAAA